MGDSILLNVLCVGTYVWVYGCGVVFVKTLWIGLSRMTMILCQQERTNERSERNGTERRVVVFAAGYRTLQHGMWDDHFPPRAMQKKDGRMTHG
jgi:hypothetical protein